LEEGACLWGLQYSIDHPITGIIAKTPMVIFKQFKEAFMEQFSTKDDVFFQCSEWHAIWQFMTVIPSFLLDFLLAQEVGNWTDVKKYCNIKTQQQLHQNMVNQQTKNRSPQHQQGP
ncbi:hypothetical protein CPB97_003248, partial [Podila verticillata]